MTEIRTKDKLFLAIAIPAALIGAYAYFWRVDASRRMDELEKRQSTLVAEEDFPLEKRRADQSLDEARAALDAERAAPFPQTQVKADAADTAAERERGVLDVFKAAGLTVVDGGAATAADVKDSGGRAASILMATGVRPAPLHRTYTLCGRYPDVVRALESFDKLEMAVIVDGITMRESGRARWTVEVWL